MQVGGQSQVQDQWTLPDFAERVLERLPLPIAVAAWREGDSDPQLMYGNQAFIDLTGLTPSVAQPAALSSILEAEAGDGPDEDQGQDCFGGFSLGSSFVQTARLARADGGGDLFRLEWAPLGMPLGDGAGWSVTFTPQDSAEDLKAALALSEAQFGAVLEHSPMEMCFRDMQGRYVATSRRFAEIYGKKREELPGKRVTDLGVAEEWVERNLRIDREVLGDRKPIVFEESIPLQDGAIEAITIKFPVIAHSGALLGIGTISSDVTQRRKVEQALRDSEECLRMIFEHAPLYMNIKDSEGRYMAVSRQLCEVHGLTPQEIYGRLPAEISNNTEWAEKVRRADLEVLKSGRLLIQEEVVQTKGGKRTVLTIKFPRRDAKGSVIGLASLGSDMTERKRAERALFQSELEAARTKALLSESIESMTDGFVWYDTDGKLILCNSKYRELFPRLAEEIRPGADYSDLMKLAFDRDQFSVMAADEVPLGQKEMPRYVMSHPTFRTKTSEGRWIEARNHPVEAGGFIGIRLDITERVQAEDALKDSEQRFKDFAESGPGGFWEMDQDLRISSFLDVQTASGPSRPSAEEAVGCTLWELFGADIVKDPYWRGFHEDFRARRPIRDLRAAFTDAKGDRYHWRINGKPHYDRSGRFSGYRGVAEDETAEIEARRHAEAAEARLIDAIESLSEGFALFDAEDRLVLCNQTYRHPSVNRGTHIVPGATFEDIIRTNVRHGYVPGLDDPEAAEAWIQQRLAHHRAAESFLQQDWNDGRSLLITERRTREGGTACIISDITELQRARKAAETANEAKTRFLAAASHDLRQPLHAIELFVAALEATVEDDDVHDIVADIREASEAAGRLLNALLDISELETGQLEGHFQAFTVQRMLDGLQRVYAHQAEDRGLKLRVVPCNQMVYSDPDLLERILGNLMSNALRYTETGKVLIGCRRRAGKIRIEVWDTGPGVPPSKREAIFEEFHQLDNPARDRRKGVGLGLSIVRRLADILGHEIVVDSVVGRGSMFAVELAAADSSVRPPPALERKAEEAFLAEGLQVLVVEDDVQSKKGMAMVLQSWGCGVHVATDYEEACAQLQAAEAPIDLIVADYRLPNHVTGVEVAVRLRRLCGREVPVLIITADQGVEPRREIAANGFKSLRKPARTEDLQAALLEVRNSRESAAQGL